MYVDIEAASRQVGGLGIGQRRRPFGRTRGDVLNRNHHAGVLAGLRGTMKMRRGRRAGQPRIGDLPAEFLALRVLGDVGRS